MQVPGPRFPTLAIILLVAASVAVPMACSEGPGPEPAAPVLSPEEQALEQQLREAKALGVLQQGRVAPVKQKLQIYASLIARYPDTRHAPQAYFLLIHHLLDREILEYKKAFQRTQAFSERHPQHINYSECYRQLYNAGKLENWGDDFVREVAKAWRAALEKTFSKGGLIPEAELIFRLDMARLTLYEGQKEKALECYTRAIELLPIENKRWELDALVECGSLQADLGRKEDARATFRRGLTLLDSWKSNSYSKADIEKLMKQLAL